MISRYGRKRLLFSLFLIGFFLLSAAVSGAQQEPKLDLKTSVDKEVKVQKNGKGATERIPAEKTDPGDILVYTIAYQNAGTVAAVDAAIVDPIPRGVVYLQGTAEGSDAEITCSIDNSRTWHRPPVMMPVKKPDGSLENKPAPMERYTHIRWVIKKPVQPGQSGRVSFKATVK
jgi:uncharacterized repeat protein (TIGR01451 family)